MKLRLVFIEYYKHAALNAGQMLQGIRYVYSHPDIDRRAPRGSFRHLMLSLQLRLQRIANDFFFAVMPPHWHHTKEELGSFHHVPAKRWFQYGYCAWRFDETGEYKTLTGKEDQRWDPRCKD